MRLRWALCALLFPAVLAAQDARLVARLPKATATRVGLLVDSARAEGLPTEPLILRALEGASKGAPEARIVLALDGLRDALRGARGVLGVETTAEDLAIAASALQAGVPRERVAELRQWRNGRSLTAPLGAYLDLVARGVPAERAWSQVSTLAQRRAPDRDYVGLGETRPRTPEEE